MNTTVEFLGPDGVLRTLSAFSTTQTTRFFTGVLPDDTVDVEVSLFGEPFTNDPTLVSFTGTDFIIPNPASFPAGLDLFSGDNVIQVRALNLTGTRSTPASITARLLPANAADLFTPPSGVTIERLDGSVKVTVQGLTDTRVVGYNFYASATQGGGAQGYNLLNVNRVVAGDKVENTTTLYTLSSDNPAQQTTELYYRAKVDQEQLDGTVLSTDVNNRVLLPDGLTTIRTDVTVSSVEIVTYYSFQHVRTANALSIPSTVFNGVFASTPDTELLYYVVTAVYFDPVLQVEYESYFSVEVSGAPVQVRQQLNGITAVSRQQIVENAIASIYRQNPNIAVQPGSVTRDTFLDPFSTEAERVRMLLDYVYRASSFDTLLLLDDPTGSGVSQPPASSAYKTALAAALFYSNVNDVQNVIDASFDKLAANMGKTRLTGKPSIGEVRFYTAAPPTQTVLIPLGSVVVGAGIQYKTTRAVSLPFDQLASYYNPSTRLYSVTVPIRSVSVGRATRVGENQITSSTIYGLAVTNDTPTFGGDDEETNAQLAARARGALSSVDPGTTRGYLDVAAEVPGTIQNIVVRAGNPLMQRDIFPGTNRHVGGKVDIWARGLQSATVDDVFAFTYQRLDDVQFVTIGNPLNYTFQAVNTDVTPSNPIAAMLNYPSLNLGLRNVTTGESFDLTNVQILNYNTIQLDVSLVQPPVTLTDIVLGDFRFRLGNKHVFTRQPVNNVLSVAGEVIGTLDLSLYSLVHPNSPLELGCSTKAGDYLQVDQSTDPTVVSPSGTLIDIPNEFHVLTGFYIEYLFNLGAETLSIVVTNELGTVTYKGPFDPSGTPDYTIVEGTSTVAAGIKRTNGSAIADGETVKISYQYYENFTVTYQINLVTSALQQALDDSSHATADVLAKQAVMVPVDVTATIVLKKGANRTNTDLAVRNNLQYLMGTLKLGNPLRRSDVLAEIDGTNGVSYVVVPLTKMVRAANVQVVRDDLVTSSVGDVFRIDAWSNTHTAVWLIVQELEAATTTGGGSPNNFRGVFQDDILLIMQTILPQNLALAVNQSYVIGINGLTIPGYGGSGTNLKNRVLVSLPVGDTPINHTYWCTYRTTEDIGDQDIVPNEMEFLVLGEVTFTYDTDR